MLRYQAYEVCLVALSLALPARGARQVVEGQTVLLIDAARAPAHILSQAQAEASRIFLKAGIELHWVTYRAGAGKSQERPAGRPLYLLVSATASGFPIHDAFGWAGVGENGDRAVVFLDRIEGHLSALPAGIRPRHAAQLLGHVMAHELGHLLLGPGGHSLTGLMTASWGKSTLMQAASGNLLFAPAQAGRMRGEVRRRATEVRAAGSNGSDRNP